jgi:cobalt/nickel transport system ATP-binding protein
MLQIDKICVKYSDGKQVLDQLDIQINGGESLGIIGENGAGKSTLLKAIVGILLPFEGEIIVNGIEMNKKNLRKIRELVGVVFQDPDNQLFMSNVYDDIAFGLRNYGVSEEEVRQRIEEIMSTLEIEKLMFHHSNKLSGGEKRIVAIATILVMKPAIVLFDEPTSFLDSKTRRKLMKLLKNLDMTKIIATHDLDMVLDICERVIILKNGQVFAQGKTKEILTNQLLLEEAGLELPYCLQNYEI